MWTLILIIQGCCSAGSSGRAMTTVTGLPTQAACVATGEAVSAKTWGVVFHCAKVAKR